MIEIKHLSKTFGVSGGTVDALKDITLTIPDGEIYGIIGMSGAGKSTLVRCINMLERPTSGEVLIDGKSMTELSQRELREKRRDITMIFQGFNLLMQRNCLKNVCFPLELAGVKKADAEKRAAELLELVGLGDKFKSYPAQLSGGQQQRVAIARALVKMPRVLLLDEPLSNLDARLRLQTREEIRKIQRATKITTVFVTHDQEEAMSISDMIVVMKDGVVQQIGKPQNVYDSPVNLFVAKFLGTPPINVFEGQIRGGSLYIGENAVLLTPGISDQPVSVGIRPEGFIPDEKGALCCQLGGMEVMGRDISVVSTHASSVNPVIRSIISSDTQIRLDAKTVRFSIKPNKIFLFRHDTGERINL